MVESPGAGLARYLRDLRAGTWPDVKLTQAQLAAAFSGEQPVVAATISTWESMANPKTPTRERLRAYARFFATRRSLDGGSHLIPEDELTEDEHAAFRSLESELLEMATGTEATSTAAAPTTTVAAAPAEDRRRGSFTFSEGRVTIICPDAPKGIRGSLTDSEDPNYTRLQRYADLDALIEIHGHIRAANPTLEVYHQLASEARSDDITSHVVLLGGVAWSEATRRFQESIGQVPITQVSRQGRDPFSVQRNGTTEVFDAQWDSEGEKADLTEDVAFLARLPNPFNFSRTLTICNGIHSRGVLGAVRCLTDAAVRAANEDYLARRFPTGRFAMLLRVPIVTRATVSPDLQNPENRLFEWPEEGAAA